MVDRHVPIRGHRSAAGREAGLVRRRENAVRGTVRRRKPGAGGGCLVIGDKGKMFNGKLSGGAQPMEVKFPESPGHVEEWIRAIKGGEPAMSNFPNYAGPLTETVLLGNLAIWAGQKVEWDAAAMRAKNVKGLESLIKPTYRPGYTLDV